MAISGENFFTFDFLLLLLFIAGRLAYTKRISWSFTLFEAKRVALMLIILYTTLNIPFSRAAEKGIL